MEVEDSAGVRKFGRWRSGAARVASGALLVSLASCAGDLSVPQAPSPKSPAAKPPSAISASQTTSPGDPSPRPVESEFADALAELDTLPIKGRAPKTGYDRALFGDAWTDDATVAGGHNGCDTRNDILRRDLVQTRL